ncbi:hypothetical protein [Kordia periserrulae]|nr:hypothetical protein [Kordia periserrulae]
MTSPSTQFHVHFVISQLKKEITMTEQTQKKTPDFNVYYVPEQSEARWIKVGAAWNNQDGQGANIQMDSLPFNFNGKLVLRAIKTS